MVGQGPLLTESLLHFLKTDGSLDMTISLDVSDTNSEDDPQIEERLYASGDVRGIIGFRDTRPFTLLIEKMSPEDLAVLLNSTGKTAVYRPDSNMGVWDVIVGKVRYNQIPKSHGDDFKVRLTLHRGIVRT